MVTVSITDLPTEKQLELSIKKARLEEKARELAAHRYSPRTLEETLATWRRFATWAIAHDEGIDLPVAPQTIARYIAQLAEERKGDATIKVVAGSIGRMHRIHGHDDPTKDPLTQLALKGATRECRVYAEQRAENRHRLAALKAELAGREPVPRRGRPGNEAVPFTAEQIRQMVDECPPDPRGVRDAAIIILGFGGGFRRSELAGILRRNIEISSEGMRILLVGTKTDQRREGQYRFISRGDDKFYCPVFHVEEFLRLYKPTGARHLFLREKNGAKFGKIGQPQNVFTAEGISGATVARAVKRAAERAGIEPSAHSAHSLRSGYATEAKNRGHSVDEIARGGGWKNLQQVYRYTRPLDGWRHSARSI